MATLVSRITDLATRIATEVAGKSTVTAGQNVGASFTLTATAGEQILIIASGAFGNITTAQTVTLNYNGGAVASHPLKQAAAADRTGISLTAVVTAVASATCSVTVTGGTLYDPKIVYLRVK
jgi:hypothetical protein